MLCSPVCVSAMPPRSALLAKLAARKQGIEKAAAAAAARPAHTDATAATATADAAAANGTAAATTAAAPKRVVQARKQAAARTAAAVAAAPPAALPAATTASDEENASESESESSSEEESSSSSESSAYSSSEDEVDAEGRRNYRIFVCPMPASCASAHSKPSKAAAAKAKTTATAAAAVAVKEPFALPPPTPSPCAAAIHSLYAATLRERFGGFGEVVAVDVRSKVGFAPIAAAAGSTAAEGAPAVERTVPLGMKACPDCLACPHCSAHEQFHYAFLTLHTTAPQLDSMLKAFRGAKFRGEMVRVERAKMDFKPRMIDERHKDKKRKHMLAQREAKKVATREQMGREGLPRELGSVSYEFKHPHGGKIFPLTESIPTREFPEADKIVPLAISELDWEEKGPPDPATIPRAPIDYELLAALFSGISSDAATVARAAAGAAVVRKKGGRKMNQKDEEEEWGALERGETEVTQAAAKADAHEDDDDDEEMQPAVSQPAAAATDLPSDDEWAMLERGGSVEPPATVAAVPAKEKATKTVAPSPKLVAAAPVPAAKTKAAVATAPAAKTGAATKKSSPKVAPAPAPEESESESESDEMDLDAEFASLEKGDDGAEEGDGDDDEAEAEAEEAEEQEEPAPAPSVPAMKAIPAAKPAAAKQAKAASAPAPAAAAASPALTPLKPAAKPAAAAKSSPALAPSVAPAAAALGVKKLTPASSWLGSDDDEDADEGADGSAEPASALDDAAAEDAAAEEQLTLRRAFHGPKGEAMRALERSFGGDARFKMDARFEEVDESAAVAASMANETPAPPISSDVARTLHPSLAALTPQELLRQQLLGEKRRALSILDQVAARPGYATLSLEELAESEAKAAKESFEHSNLPQGKSAKSLQLEAQGGTAKGKRRPDAHYTKSSFEDTMEFMSDFVPSGAASLATEGLIGESEQAAPGEATMDQIASQISSSLLRWMPLTADSSSTGQSIQDRIAIEAEDEELARRKKLRYWKDAPRFDPSKEPEAPTATAATPAAVAPSKSAAADAPKSKSKPAVAPSRLALYTPQLAPSVTAPPARDGEALFEIKTDRLRNLFTQPAPAVSFSFSATDLPAEEDKAKPGVQSFKFNFSAAADEAAHETEESAPAPAPTKRGTSFSAAPSKAATPSVSPAASASSVAAAAPIPSSSASAASSSFHIPSWPEGHPNNPHKISATSSVHDKPRQTQPQSAAPKLPLPIPAVSRASAFVKSLATAAAVGSKRKAPPPDSSDSDSDEDASGFMRSAHATPEALASKWESARAAHTHDFKSKNKSATRKSGLNALGTGMGAGAGGAAGAMQRSTTQQAMGILEQSGDYNKKQRR